MTKPKKRISLLRGLVYLSSILIFTSCCTKKECVGSDDINSIRFYGFDEQDLEGVVIKRYAKGAGFQSVIDSVVIVVEYSMANTTYQEVNLTNDVPFEYDYRIEVTGINQSFTMTDFVIKEEECNDGLLCSDHFNVLDSYQVNGVIQNYGDLRIEK